MVLSRMIVFTMIEIVILLSSDGTIIEFEIIVVISVLGSPELKKVLITNCL